MSELDRTLRELAWYPPHDPRRASPLYRKTHQHLVVELDSPCWICGVTHSKGGAMETHHSEIEWAAEKAFENDPQMLKTLVRDLHDEIKTATPDALQEFLDSEGNMLVLCATHHRAPFYGIHAITYPAWKLQRYQHKGGWEFVREAA